MTTRPPRVRKSISLDEEDLDALSRLKAGDTVAAEAYAELTGVRIGARTTEAEVLHGLLTLGSCLVREKELDLACQRAVEVDARDPDRIRWRAAMSRRHRHARYPGSTLT